MYGPLGDACPGQTGRPCLSFHVGEGGLFSDWLFDPAPAPQRWKRRPYSFAYELAFHFCFMLVLCALHVAARGATVDPRGPAVALHYSVAGLVAAAGASAASTARPLAGGALALNASFAVACAAAAWAVARLERVSSQSL